MQRTDAAAPRERFAENVVHFTRVLRRAGLPVGPDRALAAVAALEAVGLARRDDVHAALSAVMLDRHDQQPIFDAAFDAFWRDPRRIEQLMHALAPQGPGPGQKPPPPPSNRLAEALSAPAAPATTRPAAADDDLPFDATLSHSERERLQQADFETMTTEEFAIATALAERLPPPVSPVRRRRHERAPDHAAHTLDLRATMQRMVRRPELLLPAYTRPRSEWPPLVVLLDISGSMDRYARLFLHYVHGLTRRHLRVHTFTFGTRLTNISRALRHRDPDQALALVARQVRDWRGGTRIAHSLVDFNRLWARRVLTGNAALILVSDGLDHDSGGELSAAAAQLRRMAHEIVWLNPLLRFQSFEPRAAGIRALLPHVDRFLPVHNLASLADLARALREPARRLSR